MTNLTELKKAAEAATHDTWRYGASKCKCGHPVCNKYHLNMAGSNGGIDEADALFISAANPATILKLIAVVEAAQESLSIETPVFLIDALKELEK